MGYPQAPAFSPLVLLTLMLVVAASSVTFWLLVRRATSHRQWVAFADWARDHGFRLGRAGVDAVPAPLDSVRNTVPLVRLSLSKGGTTLVQVEAAPPPGAASSVASGPSTRDPR